MRRFLIWSGLAVVIGLGLAAGGFWAYDHFYARFQPVTISRGQADIQRLLDESSWVSAGGGGNPLYVIGYRDSAATQSYEREEGSKLRAAGIDVRVVMFARADREGLAQSTPAERATLAELWLTRDWTLYQRWTMTPARNWTAAGIPAADGNLARSAVVEAGRQFTTRLSALLRDAGVKTAYPVIIWRDADGFMRACACADRRSWAFIRDDLNAPDAVAPVVDAVPAQPMTPAPGVAGSQTLPYPTLPTGPAITGAPLPAPSQGQPQANSSATRPAPRPTTPTTPPGPVVPAAPKAEQQDDSTFF